jgi:hypothetical protein
MVAASANTDTLPRASVQQILGALRFIARSKTATFEQVRAAIVRFAARRSPASADAKWTTARDVLAELQRLGYVSGGPIPRQKNVLARFRESLFEVTPEGLKMATSYESGPSQAFDELLHVWLRYHSYFRAFIGRVSTGPLHIPDITSVKDVNGHSIEKASSEVMAAKVAEKCSSRLRSAGVASEIRNAFTKEVLDRFAALVSEVSLASLDAKALVDAVEDRVVVPSLLTAEALPFDPVTLQHLIKASQDFFLASWTSSHPDFAGRIVFSTCDLDPSPRADAAAPTYAIVHHGKTYAWPLFENAVDLGYKKLAEGDRRSYVSAYELRALICVQLRIQPAVFAACLEQLLQTRRPKEAAIYTEIPFEPPPKGEPYVEIGKNRTRVGRLKIAAS